MNAVTNKIEAILKSTYDTKNYVDLVNELFPNVRFVAPDKYRKEFSNFSSHIAGSIHVGNYKTPDNKNIVIMAVQLNNASYVENSRSKQRSYAKKLIENANADAAFIAFYTEGEPKWRLSFVRLDYEMKIENGRLKTAENMTPAKRYSYLVGQGEPCHTATSRFERFITDSIAIPEHPTLDDLEEAFSVEKVTNEFFELYCEKFHQLREQLEANENFRIEAEQHNFNSAQFAKKLMGQIVFLYFLQKKGWLGVSAWPNMLTEKEYKNAFYARGAKSRELIPKVYRPVGNGTYRVSGNGLNRISDADEEVLAQCVKGQSWGTGPHDFMRKLFELAEKRNINFFDELLEPLFYDALNVNRGENGYCPALHCRIPFLSGGLFEPIDGYDWKHNDFEIPNEVFSNISSKGRRDANGILDIFDRYNFTMSEDEPLEREVAIDPEMLGKVFENLLEVKDRKSKGAFYTPREIVHYMCQESLINYLINALQIEEAAVREFILYGDFMKDEDTAKDKRQVNGGMYISESLYKLDNDGNVVVNRLMEMDKALQDVRVADPAVGSGAFPLGMLNEIIRARQNISAYLAITMNSYDKRMMYQIERSPHTLKYETIRNCIFAADIEPSAVDIAQLRLWLSLVIDDEINPNAQNPLDGHRNPLPLPNLESNILCGNSLIDEFEGIRLINESDLLGNTDSTNQINMNQSRYESVLIKLIQKQDDLFRCDNTEKKKQLKDEIASLKDMIILVQLEGCDDSRVQRYYQSKELVSKPYVLWQLDFARVFREKGGFDIVIGNPPYVDSEEMTRSMPYERELYSKRFSCAKGNWDLFVPFIEKGTELLANNKVISYIVPNKFISAPYTEALRRKLSGYQMIEIRDYSNVNVFKSAAVYPVVFRIKTSIEKCPVTMDVMADIENIENHNLIPVDKFYADINWDKYFNAKAGALDIVDKMSKYPALITIADVNGAATVSEAYLVKEFIYDDDGSDSTAIKFINTGGIDKYKSYFGIEYIRYLKGKYMQPVVKQAELKKMSEKRLKESQYEKIIIGGMNKFLECLYDDGQYLAGKSTTIVYNHKHLKYITAVLNSTLMSFYYSIVYNSMSLAGGFFRIGAPQIKTLPIAIPENEKTIRRIEGLVDTIQNELKDGNESDPNIQEIMARINTEIYAIYGLNEQEIKCVEE